MAVLDAPVLIDPDEEPFPDHIEPFGHSPDTSGAVDESPLPVIVTRADTKLVVHYDARSGVVNLQNVLPLDHPRLMALLCDAALEVIHYDAGSPNGIVTTQRTATDRQARYLAQRDGPRRMPGCPGIGNMHAHHVTHHPRKQNTETADLINVCNYEHMLHHDEKLDITGDPEGTITFTFPDGRQVRSTAWRQRATAGDT